MAITNVDGIIAGGLTPQFFAKNLAANGVAGRPTSYWAVSGIPGPGSYDNTLNGTILSSESGLVNGQIPFYNAASGKQKYLGRLCAMATTAGPILLVDRLWHNGGISVTTTSPQAITTPTWPARDNNGTSNGEGILIGLEVESTTGSGTPTLTINYTNSAGVSGRTATNTFSTASSSGAGAFFMFGLQGLDRGVKSIESLTFSSTWTSGLVHLVAFRIMAIIDGTSNSVGGSVDPLTGGMPLLWDGSVPFVIVIPSSTTGPRAYGQVIYLEG